jgi:hypothetical protein
MVVPRLFCFADVNRHFILHPGAGTGKLVINQVSLIDHGNVWPSFLAQSGSARRMFD